jgi:hypothetical protein
MAASGQTDQSFFLRLPSYFASSNRKVVELIFPLLGKEELGSGRKSRRTNPKVPPLILAAELRIQLPVPTLPNAGIDD